MQNNLKGGSFMENTDRDCLCCQTFRVNLNMAAVRSLKRRFIALDTETTGLSPKRERIIEIGAVLFENAQPVREFSTLINPGIPIPAASTKIHHITDDMVSDLPAETEAFYQFLEFCQSAGPGRIIFCAHNAPFDFSFLKTSLNRLNIEASFLYMDTLRLARTHLRGLPNYKQETLELYLGLHNEKAHRALSDAKVCGQILASMIPLMEQACLAEENS